MVMETGDTTYEARKERFEYIMKRRADKPRPTYDTIGKELGISRQNVHRVVKRGQVKPSGRPKSDVARRKLAVVRLAKWQARRLDKLAANRPTEVEDAWIAKIEALIASMT